VFWFSLAWGDGRVGWQCRPMGWKKNPGGVNPRSGGKSLGGGNWLTTRPSRTKKTRSAGPEPLNVEGTTPENGQVWGEESNNLPSPGGMWGWGERKGVPGTCRRGTTFKKKKQVDGYDSRDRCPGTRGGNTTKPSFWPGERGGKKNGGKRSRVNAQKLCMTRGNWKKKKRL